MAFISYGRIDRKLFLILLFTIVREVNIIADYEAPEHSYNSHFSALQEDLSTIIAGILINIFFKQKQNKYYKDKRNFKYIIILFFLVVVKSGYERVYSYVIRRVYNEYSYYRYYAILNATNGIEIILMSYATSLILKYKYYIHHYITMFIYCILGIIIDIILGSFTTIGYDYVYCFIIFIINEVLIYCYLKYMMDKLYYPITQIILYYGIIGFIVKILIYTGIAIYEYENGIDGMLLGIKTYFTETNVSVIIFFQIIYLFITDALFYVLMILIMYYLRPNYMIVVDEIINYSEIIFYDGNKNKFYTLIPFVLQILALIFYFEFLELNFCNLNINTAKNIQIREGSELESRTSNLSIIELEDQYYINNNENKGNSEGEDDKDGDISSDSNSHLSKEINAE